MTLGWGDIPWGGSWDEASYTFGGVLRQTRSVGYTFGGYLKKRRTYTFGGYVTDPRGSFRGIGSQAQRDALDPKYAGDTFLVAAEPDQQHGQFWTGTAWISAHTVRAQEAGQARNLSTPTTGNWKAEMGDATYPFRYWDGATRKFSVDNAGNVYGNSVAFGGSGRLNTNDTITLPEQVSYTPIVRVQTASTSTVGTGTATGVWPSPTTAGNLLVIMCSGVGANSCSLGTDPTGYTLGPDISAGTADIVHSAIYYKPNCSASEANPVVSFVAGLGSANVAITITEYSGIATTSPLDQSASRLTNGISHNTGTTGTTAFPTELWIGMIAGDLSAPVAPYPPFSSIARLGTQISAAAIVTTTGQARFDSDTTSPQAGAGVIATFKASVTTLATPAANSLVVFAADRAGTTALYYKDDAGADHSLGVAGVKYARTSQVSVTNSVTETTVATYTIPGNSLAVGTVYRVRLWGTMDTPGAGPPDMNIKIKYDTSLVVATGNVTPTVSLTGKSWSLDAMVTCRVTGASGSLIGGEMAILKYANTTGGFTEAGTGTAITVNTTTDKALTATVTWSSAVSGATMYCDLATIELLNP
jgi:hypothetical protein